MGESGSGKSVTARAGLGAQKTAHLGFQNLLHRALNQIEEQVLSAETLLHPAATSVPCPLRAICIVPPLECRSLNNILRNRPEGPLQLAAQPLLQDFTDSTICKYRD
ncbi:MAG: hypothetical protein ACYCO5_04155 [Acidobacteriaceae bacterium]